MGGRGGRRQSSSPSQFEREAALIPSLVVSLMGLSNTHLQTWPRSLIPKQSSGWWWCSLQPEDLCSLLPQSELRLALVGLRESLADPLAGDGEGGRRGAGPGVGRLCPCMGRKTSELPQRSER